LPVAAEMTSIAHHVDRHLRTVDDDVDRCLAREAREGRAGYSLEVVDANAWDVFDAGAGFA